MLRMEGRKIREPRSLRASLNQHADILLCEKENLKHLITTTKNHLCSSPVSSVHGTLQARILEWVARHSLLQGISPTQGSNLGLLHCRQILYHVNHQGSPKTFTCTINSAVTEINVYNIRVFLKWHTMGKSTAPESEFKLSLTEY